MNNLVTTLICQENGTSVWWVLCKPYNVPLYYVDGSFKIDEFGMFGSKETLFLGSEIFRSNTKLKTTVPRSSGLCLKYLLSSPMVRCKKSRAVCHWKCTTLPVESTAGSLNNRSRVIRFVRDQNDSFLHFIRLSSTQQVLVYLRQSWLFVFKNLVQWNSYQTAPTAIPAFLGIRIGTNYYDVNITAFLIDAIRQRLDYRG